MSDFYCSSGINIGALQDEVEKSNIIKNAYEKNLPSSFFENQKILGGYPENYWVDSFHYTPYSFPSYNLNNRFFKNCDIYIYVRDGILGGGSSDNVTITGARFENCRIFVVGTTRFVKTIFRNSKLIELDECLEDETIQRMAKAADTSDSEAITQQFVFNSCEIGLIKNNSPEMYDNNQSSWVLDSWLPFSLSSLELAKDSSWTSVFTNNCFVLDGFIPVEYNEYNRLSLEDIYQYLYKNIVTAFSLSASSFIVKNCLLNFYPQSSSVNLFTKEGLDLILINCDSYPNSFKVTARTSIDCLPYFGKFTGTSGGTK